MADARTIAALDAYVKLLRAGRAVMARVEPRLAASGFTLTQYGVLETILHKGPLSQRELSRKLHTSAGNMTDLIDKLEARFLVSRTRQKSDRRAVLIELTETGRELVEPLSTRHAADIAAAMVGLNETELRQLSELLRRLGRGAASATLDGVEARRTVRLSPAGA